MERSYEAERLDCITELQTRNTSYEAGIEEPELPHVNFNDVKIDE